MIAAPELYPDRSAVVKNRDDDEERWGAMRIDGKHVLGDRAGVASYTLFNGWIHRLPEGLPEEMRFICVPERGLPDIQIVAVLNSVNLFGLFFAGLALYSAYHRSGYVFLFLALVGAYLWFIRRIGAQINARRKRGQERLYRAHGKGPPPWVTTQHWVGRTDSELDQQLFDRMGALQREMVGYDVGLACLNGQAWMVVDDPYNQGPPPPFGRDRLYLLESPVPEETEPSAGGAQPASEQKDTEEAAPHSSTP